MATLQLTAEPIQLNADFSAKTGRTIRPLHGVNSGPKVKVFTYDMTPQYKELGIPYVRLHDTEYPYGSGEFVDIHCVFPNWDADETKEESYNFGLTDEYIKAIFEAGGEPIYRLGESIEHAPVKRHIYPPKDYAKWARIAEHIIRHYCYGWANGFHYTIQYWEIFNESDGSRRNPDFNGTWIGTPEQFHELYCVTARHLKKCFPELKIGGCGWTRATNSFIDSFFQYLEKENEKEYVPLDFFSWHRYYSDMDVLLPEAKVAEEQIDKYYPNAESVFDEWNYVEDWADQPICFNALKDYRGAAFCAATLAALQTKTRVTVATYFEGDVTKEWSGLFSVDQMTIGKHGRKASVRPGKPFYAFKAFNELYKMGNEVNATITFSGQENNNIQAVAASKDGQIGLLFANSSNQPCKLELHLENLPKDARFLFTDEMNTFREDEPLIKKRNEAGVPEVIYLRARSFLFITNTL